MGVPLGVIAGGVPRRLPHGEVITRQGDAVASLYLVTAGAVRLASVSPDGREIVVGLLGPGDVFGEMALVGGPSPVEARAVGGAEVVAIASATLHEIVWRHPATAEQLLRLIASRLHRTSLALEDALAGDVRTRVRRRLRDLANLHGSPDRDGVRLRVPITQEELARMVGASRETVNRAFAHLVASGLIRQEDRGYLIPDPDALDSARA